MHKIAHKLKELGWRRIAFSLVVLMYLGFLGYINVMMFLPGSGVSAMGHFSFIRTGDTHDFIHELVFAFIIGIAAIGLFSQLWKPKENFAGQLVALVAWIVMFFLAIITNNGVPQPLFIIFGGLTLLATILHPAGRGLFDWFSIARIHRVLFALVVIAAIPLFVFAYTNFSLQTAGSGGAGLFEHKRPNHDGTNRTTSMDAGSMTVEDEMHDQKHINLGHYRNLVAFSFIIILVGLLASFRPRGWRFAAWVAGFLPILLGLASIILPDAESSLGLVWGLLSIAWGIVFIAAAEFTKDSTDAIA